MNTEEHKGTALLLRKYDFRDTSLIVHWFCQEKGLLKTVVKGGKGKAYAGKLEVFTLCALNLQLSSRSELHSLRDVAPKEYFTGLRASYHKLTVASYFSGLVEQCLHLEQPSPEIFDLLLRSLHYLNEKEEEWRAIPYFEKEVSRALGFGTAPTEAHKLYTSSAKLEEMRNRISDRLRKENP